MKGIAVLASAAVLAVLAIPAISAGQSAPLQAVDVSLNGGVLTVSGAPQSGAATINITNSGKDAEITLVHLNPGVTPDQAFAMAPQFRDPNDVAQVGSIVYDADAPKGSATSDTVLAAGDYLALDTSGNDPSKWPHAAFTVTKAATEAALPAADATISAVDFGFKAPKSIKRGSVVRFSQTGYVVHMIAAVKVKNAFAAKQVMKLLKAGKDKKAQKAAIGFADFLGPSSHGAVQQLTVDAKPGTYVLACFMTTQDGREHTRLGMLRMLKVKK